MLTSTNRFSESTDHHMRPTDTHNRSIETEERIFHVEVYTRCVTYMRHVCACVSLVVSVLQPVPVQRAANAYQPQRACAARVESVCLCVNAQTKRYLEYN